MVLAGYIAELSVIVAGTEGVKKDNVGKGESDSSFIKGELVSHSGNSEDHLVGSLFRKNSQDQEGYVVDGGHERVRKDTQEYKDNNTH